MLGSISLTRRGGFHKAADIRRTFIMVGVNLNVGDLPLTSHSATKTTRSGPFPPLGVGILSWSSIPWTSVPLCTGELKDLATVAEKYDAAGAEVVGISVDSRWAHAAFKKHENLTATLPSDFQPRGEVARLYDAFLDTPESLHEQLTSSTKTE